MEKRQEKEKKKWEKRAKRRNGSFWVAGDTLMASEGIKLRVATLGVIEVVLGEEEED